MVNLSFVYELGTWSRDLNIEFTLKDCLFGSVKLTKTADPDKYKYSSYGIGLNSRSAFSLPGRSMGKNAIIFEADMSSSAHLHNKGKDILILGEGPAQGLDDSKFTVEAKSPVNFTQSNKNFCIIMGATVFYLLIK